MFDGPSARQTPEGNFWVLDYDVPSRRFVVKEDALGHYVADFTSREAEGNERGGVRVSDDGIKSYAYVTRAIIDLNTPQLHINIQASEKEERGRSRVGAGGCGRTSVCHWREARLR